MSDELSTSFSGQLGPYLRACRERTSPRDVGLPDSGRRRTPGLRREEVATLAGVSVDYLVRLEQGRDIHPSAEVLAALADAMRLGEDERMHLFNLGIKSGNESLCPAQRTLATGVAPTVERLLGALDPTPAFVVAPSGDIVAWNETWAAVVAPLGMLDSDEGEPPNLARYVFAHPGARLAFTAWRTVADQQVARLRRASTYWAADERFRVVVAELRALPDFAVRWDAHPVGEQRRATTVVSHPDVGDLALDVEVLDLADGTDQQLVSWLPADDATAARVARVVDPAPLRLVTG